MRTNTLTQAILKLTPVNPELSVRKFIVGSMDTSQGFSTSAFPVLHNTYDSAIKEAKRLAGLDPHGRKFLVLQIAGGAKSQSVIAF